MARVRPVEPGGAGAAETATAGGGHGGAPAGPASLTAREALRLATTGGAQCLGWESELGSLEPGKLADLALWRLDGIGHVDIADPVAALVLGSPPLLSLLLVGGRTVVEDAELRTADVTAVARRARAAAGRLSPAGTRATKPLTMKVR
jgi:cytosine/adenosine deaminase-related metal-dependent hydrolase